MSQRIFGRSAAIATWEVAQRRMLAQRHRGTERRRKETALLAFIEILWELCASVRDLIVPKRSPRVGRVHLLAPGGPASRNVGGNVGSLARQVLFLSDVDR